MWTKYRHTCSSSHKHVSETPCTAGCSGSMKKRGIISSQKLGADSPGTKFKHSILRSLKSLNLNLPFCSFGRSNYQVRKRGKGGTWVDSQLGVWLRVRSWSQGLNLKSGSQLSAVSLSLWPSPGHSQSLSLIYINKTYKNNKRKRDIVLRIRRASDSLSHAPWSQDCTDQKTKVYSLELFSSLL